MNIKYSIILNESYIIYTIKKNTAEGYHSVHIAYKTNSKK